MQEWGSLECAGAPLFYPFLDAGGALSVTERLLDLFGLCLLFVPCFGL
jgi:hypothetical protein